jgi:hypothetical protein
MKSLKYILLITFLGTLFMATSCNDEEDLEAPITTILSPSNNEIFSVGDTINIHFEVAENDELHHIIANLLNESGEKIWNRNMHDHSQLFVWKDQYIVNESLAGQSLSLIVEADDHNGNLTQEMVEISIE